MPISCIEDRQPPPDCDIQGGPCSRTIGSTEVILDITPRPVIAMNTLRFEVKLRNFTPAPERLILDLRMPGMEMGINQVVLTREPSGSYSGKGIIVKCPSGRKLWKATIWIPDTGETAFVFEVN